MTTLDTIKLQKTLDTIKVQKTLDSIKLQKTLDTIKWQKSHDTIKLQKTLDTIKLQKKMSSRKYYYYRRPIAVLSENDMPDRRLIGDLMETYWRPIGDRYAWSETSTCLIGDLSETDMPQYIIAIYINKQKVY